MIYRDLLGQPHKDLKVCAGHGILKLDFDAGEIAVLGRTEDIVFPFRPASGFYHVYLDAHVFTVIHDQVISAIYRQFST